MNGLQQADGTKTAVHQLCRKSLCERCKTDTFKSVWQASTLQCQAEDCQGGKAQPVGWSPSASYAYMDKHSHEDAMVKVEVHLR